MKPRNTGLSEEAAFERFTDLMAKLMVKYGPDVLRQRREELMRAIQDSVEITPVMSPETLLSRLKAYQSKVDSAMNGMENKLKTT